MRRTGTSIIVVVSPFAPRKPRSFAERKATLLAIAAVVAISGCDRHSSTADKPSDEKPKVARSEVERGPVQLSVTVDPSPARLSDEPTLTLEIDYAAGDHGPQAGVRIGPG